MINSNFSPNDIDNELIERLCSRCKIKSEYAMTISQCLKCSARIVMYGVQFAWNIVFLVRICYGMKLKIKYASHHQYLQFHYVPFESHQRSSLRVPLGLVLLQTFYKLFFSGILTIAGHRPELFNYLEGNVSTYKLVQKWLKLHFHYK